MRTWLFLLAASPCFAQIGYLATPGDGHTVFFRSQFRLQTETDQQTRQGRIYQWLDGSWPRIATPPNNGGIAPPDVYGPFVSRDGQIIGWQIYLGCGSPSCGLAGIPRDTSQVTGAELPSNFPRGHLLMSSDGRFFVADTFAGIGTKHLDRETGRITDVPAGLFTLPACFRQLCG